MVEKVNVTLCIFYHEFWVSGAVGPWAGILGVSGKINQEERAR